MIYGGAECFIALAHHGAVAAFYSQAFKPYRGAHHRYGHAEGLQDLILGAGTKAQWRYHHAGADIFFRQVGNKSRYLHARAAQRCYSSHRPLSGDDK